MIPVTSQYAFRQRFPFSPDRAFRWCVDFQSGDLRLEGYNGVRALDRITDDLLLLTDTFSARGRAEIRKVNLVRRYRRTRSWTSTHLSGPNQHSQF